MGGNAITVPTKPKQVKYYAYIGEYTPGQSAVFPTLNLNVIYVFVGDSVPEKAHYVCGDFPQLNRWFGRMTRPDKESATGVRWLTFEEMTDELDVGGMRRKHNKFSQTSVTKKGANVGGGAGSGYVPATQSTYKAIRRSTLACLRHEVVGFADLVSRLMESAKGQDALELANLALFMDELSVITVTMDELTLDFVGGQAPGSERQEMFEKHLRMTEFIGHANDKDATPEMDLTKQLVDADYLSEITLKSLLGIPPGAG